MITKLLSIIYITLLYFIDEIINFSSITTFTLVVPIIICMINPLLNLFRVKKRIINNKYYYVILNIVLIINILVLINNFIFMINNPTVAYLHNFDYLLFTTPLFIIPFIWSFFLKKTFVIGKDNDNIILLIIIIILEGISLIDRQAIIVNVLSTIMPIILISQNLTSIVTRTSFQKYYFILGILALIGGNPLVTLLYGILYINADYTIKNI